MPNQHVLILGSGAAGVAAARALASREDVRVTLVARTGETPYIRMHIKGVAFGPTPRSRLTRPRRRCSSPPVHVSPTTRSSSQQAAGRACSPPRSAAETL